MFDPCPTARVFGLPPGVDFPKALVLGLIARHADHPPEALARVQLYVNTQRMQRRVQVLFDQGPALLLPQIRLVTDLAQDMAMADIPPPVPGLRRRLELSQLIGQLLDQAPDLAARASIYDLSDSLAQLMDEMQGEGVSPDIIAGLDVSDQSGHWARSLAFINIVQRYFGDTNEAPDAEARQRLVIERLVETWSKSPPSHPVLIAGSTGSRGATHMLMQAAARLPQGALILPGFDFDLPDAVWSSMDDALTAEDHPQYRYRKLMASLDLSPGEISAWSDETPPNTPRNRLVSLALRPAPVTDQWMDEGRHLKDIDLATQSITLINAASGRAEATAIALRLRQAAEDGTSAALITPDRILTRQVAAALDRWNIEADDSAGLPLQLSAPGRFLRHISSLFGRKMTSEALLTLLKHPLSNTGGDERGPHLLWSRELELELRRNGPPFPTAEKLRHWAAAHKQSEALLPWANWLAELLFDLDTIGTTSLTLHLDRHITLAEALTSGPDGKSAGELWREKAGREALKMVRALEREAAHGGDLSPADYNDLFRAVLGRGEVRDPIKPHANIMIWGTLEARVQGADLVILAGLNDGIWPEQPAPDPWLNRNMRHKAGLLLPERRIGLSAHDFQQAVAAKEVWLTRAVRDAEAETVPSRWLNRINHLLAGLTEQNGKAALASMNARGDAWLSMAAALEAPSEPIAPEKRPSPRPPVAARPTQLSVTSVKTLIRDPYAIYARYVLGLRALDPLRQLPDAPLRGTVLHHVFERFIKERRPENREAARQRLLAIASEILAEKVPWPTARRIWLAKLNRVVDWFLDGEVRRSAIAEPVLFETKASQKLDDLDFTLTGITDRIDRAADGRAFVYDYKTGAPPSAKEQLYFDKQLLLEAALIEQGAFGALGPAEMGGASYIGLGSSPKEVQAPLADVSPDQVWDELHQLIRDYFRPEQGYTARRAMAQVRFAGEYDHLARFGEWDDSDLPVARDVP